MKYTQRTGFFGELFGNNLLEHIVMIIFLIICDVIIFQLDYLSPAAGWVYMPLIIIYVINTIRTYSSLP